MEEFFTIKEAARVLKVHPITIRRYIKEGKLKAIKAAGNIRVAKADFKDFTKSFVPSEKSTKSRADSATASFSFADPIFRLKARGIGIGIQNTKIGAKD